MYEYKVDIYKVKYAEDAMNALAKERWRVIAISPDHHTGFIDVFYEREKLEEAQTEEAEPLSASVAVTDEDVLADRAAFSDDYEMPAYTEEGFAYDEYTGEELTDGGFAYGESSDDEFGSSEYAYDETAAYEDTDYAIREDIRYNDGSINESEDEQ